VSAVTEHGQHLVGFRSHPAAEPEQSAENALSTPERRWGLRLPSLPGRSALSASSREERAREKERGRALASAEAAMEAFFQTPVGRARLAYKRGHRLFQYELEIDGLEPTIVPGPVGSPARETTDPVDILNAVTVEGWKLVTGKFVHSEIRNGVIGCYLFKRSQKRRLAMNNPWQDHGANG
jgi:hypothetical protein